MADKIFEDSRLVSIYDYFDGERKDLEHYLAIAKELSVQSILDIGCGTGSFACLLSSQGFDVTGIDPAWASIEYARKKPFADKVKWFFGDMSCLPPLRVDMAVMTGNVAQVFLTDREFKENLILIHQVLSQEGFLVFEARNPAQKAWQDWNKEKTFQRLNIPGAGEVQGWCQVTNQTGSLISFQWTYIFEKENLTLTSDSTLRFREQEEIEHLLKISGFRVKEVRDAPDRQSKEFVFIATPVAN